MDVDRSTELGCTTTLFGFTGAFFGYFAYRVMDHRQFNSVEYRGQWFVCLFIERRLAAKSV